MSNVRNIRKSVNNIVTAATSTVAVGTEVVADTTGLISGSIAATPDVLKALLTTPFSAAKGYLIEAEGLTEEQARAVAFKYLEQDLAVTITEVSEGAGKLAAAMFEDDEDDVDNADISAKKKDTAAAAA